MGRFLIFLAAVLVLALFAILIWWIWNKVNIAIKRQKSAFDIEKEAYKKMRRRIKEDKET